ncbi:MAG: hypothetical protein ABR587_00810 [Candidatus Binatia bacterium]
MKQSLKTFIGAATVASLVFAAGTASAQSKVEAKCHSTIGKNISKYQATATKNLIGCHKSRDGGKVIAATQCNTATGADLKGKRASARQKAIDGINKACIAGASPDFSDNVLALYPRCPSPASTSDDGGATTGIDTFTELATCLLDLSEAYVDRMGAQVMGNPATVPLTDKNVSKCHGAIGKAFSKAVKTVGGTYTKCQAAQEKLGAGLDYDASCLDGAGDSKGKVAAAFLAFDATIDASCSGALVSQEAWADLGTCGQSTTAMKTCAGNRVIEPTSKGLAAAALELPGTCVGVADVVINAGFGNKLSNTRLDSGWKGSAHKVDVIDDSLGAVTLSGCDPDCRDCAVTHNSKNDSCRCSNDATVSCDTINAPDAACGGNTCHCMFGPPLAISASSTPVCVVNRFVSEFNGSTGVVGEYSVGTATRALVHTGLSQTQPCPTCEGGICDGGLRNGQACSIDATHPTFGAVSFDCPPSPGSNISGSGLLLDLEFSSGSQSITAGIPTGAFCGSGPCHCSVCSLNVNVGCQVDADCAAVGAGTCGQALANNPSQNNCDTTCTTDGNGNGQCDGPIDSFCSDFVKGDGTGIISCTGDLDCDANDCNGDNNLTPGECGTCTLAGFRQCFLPTVNAEGTPGIYNSEGVSVFCSGQTGNGGVDNAGGLPGPGRVTLDFDFNLYCDNGTTQFQLPAGSNCP